MNFVVHDLCSARAMVKRSGFKIAVQLPPVKTGGLQREDIIVTSRIVAIYLQEVCSRKSLILTGRLKRPILAISFERCKLLYRLVNFLGWRSIAHTARSPFDFKRLNTNVGGKHD
jgi:hypothetical protein